MIFFLIILTELKLSERDKKMRSLNLKHPMIKIILIWNQIYRPIIQRKDFFFPFLLKNKIFKI